MSYRAREFQLLKSIGEKVLRGLTSVLSLGAGGVDLCLFKVARAGHLNRVVHVNMIQHRGSPDFSSLLSLLRSLSQRRPSQRPSYIFAEPMITYGVVTPHFH